MRSQASPCAGTRRCRHLEPDGRVGDLAWPVITSLHVPGPDPGCLAGLPARDFGGAETPRQAGVLGVSAAPGLGRWGQGERGGVRRDPSAERPGC